MKKIIIGFVAVLVLGGVWLGIKKDNKDDMTIRIGATESLTGSASYYGGQAKKGIDLAVERVSLSKWNSKKIKN